MCQSNASRRSSLEEACENDDQTKRIMADVGCILRGLGFAFADLPRGKGLCGHARSVKFCLSFPDDMYTKCLSPCILPPSPCLPFQVFHRRRDEEGHPRRPPEPCHMS